MQHHPTPADGALNRRALLARMAAGGAVVWASPLVTRTAHAQAMGTCLQSGVLRWSDAPWSSWLPGNGQSVSGEVESTGVNATVTTTQVNTTSLNNPVTGYVDHTLSTVGGVSYIQLAQSVAAANDTFAEAHRSIEVTFDAPVTNVAFAIQNIDRFTSANNVPNWDDRVSVSAVGGTVTALGSSLTGTNSTAVGFYRNANGELTFPNPVDGIANFIVNGSVTSITINFWNGDRNSRDGHQRVYLSEISFGCG